MKIKLASDDATNRHQIEKKLIDVLMSPEAYSRKDKLKSLDSGLNEIISRIASKNKVLIGIDLEEIKKLSIKEKAIRLARIVQNIKIARKTKTNFYFKSEAREAKSILLSLGASTEQSSKVQAQSF